MDTQSTGAVAARDGAAAYKDKLLEVLVTRRCSLACAFCDRVNAMGDMPLDRLQPEIERVSRASEEVRFTGGDPLLHPSLLELVRLAKQGGAQRVSIATPAVRLTESMARDLAAAGVTSLLVTVVATTPDEHRRHSRNDTELALVLGGMNVALAAGLDVAVALPLALGLPPAADRLRECKELIPALKSFVLVPTGLGAKTVVPGQALEPDVLAQELADCVDAGDQLKLSVTLSSQHVIAPCVVDLPLRARRLLVSQLRWEGNPTRNRIHEACDRCVIARRCALRPEQYAQSAGTRQPVPLTDATVETPPPRQPGDPRGRLKVLGAAEVENFYHVDYEYPDGVEIEKPTSRLGIIYRCNQVCTFCSLAEMDTHLTPDKIRAAIDASRARGSVRIIITGGEPTLSPHVFDYIRYARDKGFEVLEMQTNAIVIDRPGYAERLREAGLTHAQVSLHGPDSAISDRMTAAPGTHRRTMKGVDALLRVGVHVLLNHLIFKDNCHLLVDFVDMVEARWGQYRSQLTIQFHAAMNEYEYREDAVEHIARYSDYVPTLLRAFDRMTALGYPGKDLQDPTGIPSLCLLKANPHYLGPILSQQVRPRFHRWETRWLTRVDACNSCEAAELCMGVPRHYVKLFGEAEFTPIRLPVESGHA